MLPPRRCGVLTLLLCVSGLLPAQEPAAARDVLLEGRTLLEQGRASDAVTLLRPYVEGHPDSAGAVYLLGYAYYATREPRLSLESYTRGAALRKPTAEDLMAVSADYILLDDYADAAKWLAIVTSMQPTNALAWYYEGRALHLMGRYVQALGAFEHALQLQPGYVRAEVGAGLSQEALNKDDAALEAYKVAAAWQAGLTKQDAQPYLSAGELLLKEGKDDLALGQLEQAAKLSHENPRVLEDLGRAYERLGNLPKAEVVLEAAEHLAPQSSSIHFLLGTAYLRESKKAEAQREFGLSKGLIRDESNHATENFDLQP